MADKIGMHMDQKTVQSQKQQQRLIMLPQMQQAIQILQVPILELASLVEAEMERNPILEYEEASSVEEESAWGADDYEGTPAEQEMTFDDNNFEILRQLDEDFREHFLESENYSIKRSNEEERRLTFLESIVCEEQTLTDYLMAQARESFEDIRDLKMAEILIGYLDDSGFISTSLEEIALLHQYDHDALQEIAKIIQTFDPPGVGAYNLQESLLLQLQRVNKGMTVAYEIIEQCYEDLLHNRIPVIAKRLGRSSLEISNVIVNDIARLDLHPGRLFSKVSSQHIIADVTIRREGDQLTVDTNQEPIPHFRVNRRYLRMLDDPTLSLETEEFIKQKLASAKWLMRTIDQRNDTVKRIAESLVKRQMPFFMSPDGKLSPLTMKVVAEDLELHESTIARAVSNKYLNSPRGLLPLRSFFTNALETEKGEDISSSTARDMLRKIIQGEDKKRPLSDDAIARLMNKQGIKCARRTVAKYRGELGLGNAQQRRQYR